MIGDTGIIAIALGIIRTTTRPWQWHIFCDINGRTSFDTLIRVSFLFVGRIFEFNQWNEPDFRYPNRTIGDMGIIAIAFGIIRTMTRL